MTSTAQSDTATVPSVRQRSVVRPEIQALRAIAVIAVVIYHLWPTHLPGGFVGVDVFFAISGYLIIGHLLREVKDHGRIRLLDFWARRARRLLPASLLVLVATAIVTLLCVPNLLWKQFFSEIGASALYVQNWLLSANSVDYLAAANSPSPVEHFWSLSVEEQFYIAWPIILILLLTAAGISRRIKPLSVIGGALIVLTVASFLYSLTELAQHPSQAYFVTPSRAWEFGLGGVVAFFAAQPLVGRDSLRAVASWLGLAIIAATLVTYTPHTPFPGAAALPPVAGTLLTIWAGTPNVRWAPTAVMKLRPVQYLGDISYSLYLWHWPLIILVPFVFERELTGVIRLAILLAAVVLAALTKRFVEDPARTGALLASRPPWVSLASLLTITVLVAAACGGVYLYTQNQIDRARQDANRAVSHNASCVGAAAVLPAPGCARPYAVTSLTNPSVAENDIGKGVQTVDPCKQLSDVATVMTCTVGDTTKPRQTWALVGDSHAGQYLEALNLYGKTHGVEVITYLKSWCAGTGVPGVSTFGDDSPAAVTSCATWGHNVLGAIAANPNISTVVFGDYTTSYLAGTSNVLGQPLTAKDFLTAWHPLTAKGKTIVGLRDIPSSATDAPGCVAQNLLKYDPCSLPRATAVLPAAEDPLIAATRADAKAGAHLIDNSDVFCTGATCHVVIGGLIAYFGGNHMTATFSRTLAPIVGERISKVAGGAPKH